MLIDEVLIFCIGKSSVLSWGHFDLGTFRL